MEGLLHAHAEAAADINFGNHPFLIMGASITVDSLPEGGLRPLRLPLVLGTSITVDSLPMCIPDVAL